MVWPGVTLAYKSYHFRRDALFSVELTNGLPELLLITLLVLITTVADREAAVFLRRQLQPFPFANLIQVSDEHRSELRSLPPAIEKWTCQRSCTPGVS